MAKRSLVLWSLNSNNCYLSYLNRSSSGSYLNSRVFFSVLLFSGCFGFFNCFVVCFFLFLQATMAETH